MVALHYFVYGLHVELHIAITLNWEYHFNNISSQCAHQIIWYNLGKNDNVGQKKKKKKQQNKTKFVATCNFEW